MEQNEKNYMYARKRLFIELIEKGLLEDSQYNGIESITYYQHNDWEFIRVDYRHGYTVDINVTGNSNGANLNELAAEVYGKGAIGRMKRSIEEVIGCELN